MKIGNISISDNWKSGLTYRGNTQASPETYYYKSCLKRIKHHTQTHFIVIGKEGATSWLVRFGGFPDEEYVLFYGSRAKFKFESLREAQNHIDNFLVKLNSLKVFL